MDDPLWAGTAPRPADEPQPQIGAEPVDVQPGAGDPTPPAGALRLHGARRRRWPSRVAAALAAILALGVVYYGVSLYQVWSTGRSDQARPVDAIVVLGAAQYDGRPSPILQARLDHALALYQQGLAPYVFVTGGNQPGDRFTEAEASAAYLVERGVPGEAILREDAGGSTWESMKNVAEQLDAAGLGRVLLVTDPYHSLRSRLVAEELGLTAYVSPTRTSPVRGGSVVGKELKEAAGVAVGRIVGFERLFSWTG